MLSRRQDENTISSTRWPMTQSSRKPTLNENVKPKPTTKGEPLKLKDTAPHPTKPAPSELKPAKTPLSRKALSSLTNGTPSQTRTIPRQPLTAKPPTTIKKPSFTSTKSVLAKTPSAKPQGTTRPKSTKKVLSVYTPKTAVPVEDSGDDEIEYMAPTAIERKYEPLTSMRVTKLQDEEFFAPGTQAGAQSDMDTFEPIPLELDNEEDPDDLDDLHFDF